MKKYIVVDSNGNCPHQLYFAKADIDRRYMWHYLSFTQYSFILDKTKAKERCNRFRELATLAGFDISFSVKQINNCETHQSGCRTIFLTKDGTKYISRTLKAQKAIMSKYNV